MFVQEIEKHLRETIVPFWRGMRDLQYGGFYGFMDFEGKVDPKAVKGCILNSRILWFFSNAARLLDQPALSEQAGRAYGFLRNYCLDREYGGIYWSVTYDGKVADPTKHTYCQAFAIYGLSSYYKLTKNPEALELALDLFSLVEEKCTDEKGYLEAFKRDFSPESNEKLSENGVMAEKTMNTLLHVFEAYTELYDACGDLRVRERLLAMLDMFQNRVYNKKRHRLEVFFDKDWNTLIDLHSFGHDIEASWLIDRGCAVLGDPQVTARMAPITRDLADCVYREAFNRSSLSNECERGKVDETRIWWVQAEAVVGFLNAWEKDHEQERYLKAAREIWTFIRDHVADHRKGMEWFRSVGPDGEVKVHEPIIDEWKCPYHNGRMCIEVIRRLKEEEKPC